MDEICLWLSCRFKEHPGIQNRLCRIAAGLGAVEQKGGRHCVQGCAGALPSKVCLQSGNSREYCILLPGCELSSFSSRLPCNARSKKWFCHHQINTTRQQLLQCWTVFRHKAHKTHEMFSSFAWHPGNYNGRNPELVWVCVQNPQKKTSACSICSCHSYTWDR